GADNSYIIYRRSREEMPARAEEAHHAVEEGVKTEFLTLPVEYIGDNSGWVKKMRCRRMKLGEPDASGRRRPVEIPGSDFEMEVDAVIVAIGNSPNPLIPQTTPKIQTGKHGTIVANEETMQTTMEGVFAGGDIVSGAATVISAMGHGKKAARGIHKFLGC
ncbi:MAG: FAD-dependent oxidoreductase, partial [Planctomycetota bacterium]|nr:FAD-dependent oxidoreductase [Planctomycetota bacterium]